MADKIIVKQSGVGFFSLLLLLFIALKLTGVINWSWIWVLSPFWIPLGIFLGFLLIGLVLLGISKIMEK